MMKFLVLAICLSSLYVKEIAGAGGIYQDLALQVENLKNEVEKELQDMVEPIRAGAQKLEDRLAAYRLRQSEVELVSLWNINFTACFNFGETLENSTALAWNISNTAYEIVMNVSDSFNALTSKCSSSWDPVTDVKCFVTNIKTIENEITRIKPLIKIYENVIMKLALKIEDEFFTCIGENQPKPTEKPTDKPTTKTTEKPTEKTTQKTTPVVSTTKKSSNDVITTKKPWWHFW